MGSNGLTGWFTYLEEECLGPDGLLCFYDFPRSSKVSYSCEVLAKHLTDPADNAAQSFFSLL